MLFKKNCRSVLVRFWTYIVSWFRFSDIDFFGAAKNKIEKDGILLIDIVHTSNLVKFSHVWTHCQQLDWYVLLRLQRLILHMDTNRVIEVVGVSVRILHMSTARTSNYSGRAIISRTP